ncbi:cytochrome P450 [Marasmius fiardii PR-910]|nr:cytochrome P450 [Marasmius fiardii PR-910]
MSLGFSLLYLLLLTLGGGIVALVIRARRKSLKFLRGPPSPSLLLGHEWSLSCLRRIESPDDEWFGEYGAAFRLAGCYGEDILMLADPKGLQHIFHKSAYRYPKPKDVQRIAAKMFGSGILVVDGGDHQRQRKLLNPSFSASQVKPFAEVFESCVRSVIRKWQAQIESSSKDSAGKSQAVTIDTVRWLPNMALDALGESMFEYEFGALEGTKNSVLCDIIRDVFLDSRNPTKLKMLRQAAYRFLPNPIIKLMDIKKTKEDKRFAHWLATSRVISNDLVNMKTDDAGQEGRNDFMSVLSRALYTSIADKSMSSAEALSQMATIIFAGHETSASTLSWCLYQLSKHPKEQEIIFQEIKNVREQTRNESDPLTVKDLDGPGMAHLNRVIKETLRLHPIAPDLVREAGMDDVIPLDYPIMDASGSVLTQIPVVKGQRVHVNIYQYNRDKELWGEDAHEWKPSRFTDHQKPTTTLGVYGNLMTFSGGVRSCIGWRFAVLEIQVVLAALVESFVFSVPDGVEVEQMRPGLGTPLVKGRWAEGAQMPLTITLRA